MHIAPSTTTASTALVRRAARTSRERIFATTPAPQRRATWARECLRRRLQVLIPMRMSFQDLIQDREKAAVLAERAWCGRNFCGGSDGEFGHGWVSLQICEDVGGRRSKWIREDFLTNTIFCLKLASDNYLIDGSCSKEIHMENSEFGLKRQ